MTINKQAKAKAINNALIVQSLDNVIMILSARTKGDAVWNTEEMKKTRALEDQILEIRTEFARELQTAATKRIISYGEIKETKSEIELMEWENENA